jgi:cytochrome d ubiquinol oxidase subunit I
VWVTFLAIAGLYVGVAVTLVLVLRAMSRRFRAQGSHVELDGPYGPRAPQPATTPVEAPVGVGGDHE